MQNITHDALERQLQTAESRHSRRALMIELTVWAILFALAYFPFQTSWLAWIALARPLILLSKLNGRKVFKYGYFFSLIFNAVCLYWIAYVTPPGYIATVLILSIYSAAVFGIFGAIQKRHEIAAFIVFPILWVGMEYFRGLSQLSFPWTDLAYTQVYYLKFVQIASVTGMAGVSLIVAIVNVLIAMIMRDGVYFEHRMTLAGLVIVLLVGTFGYGWVVTPAYQKQPEYRVALLQGNFPVEEKWDKESKDRVFAVYDSLADSAGRAGAELIIWPETAAPTYLLFDRNYVLAKTRHARMHGANNLIGTMHADASVRPPIYFNAAVQMDSAGNFSAPYLKQKLVPFAEQVPYQDYFPFLRREFLEKYLTFIETYDVQWWSDFKPGDSLILMESDGYTYAPFICFEVAYPEFIRKSLHEGAQFIVTITNDTWFKKSPGPYQHKYIAILRGIENRAWVARAANSGFTFISDPYGNVRNEMPWYERGLVIGSIDENYHPSIYYRHGPIVGKLCYIYLLATLLFFGVNRLLRRAGMQVV